MIPSDVLDRIKEEVERLERLLSDESDGTCVKKLFGLCSCRERRECYIPANRLDKMVHQALKEFEEHVCREVVERAKVIWVERERFAMNPVDIALKLLTIAGQEIEKRKGKSNPSDWIVYV